MFFDRPEAGVRALLLSVRCKNHGRPHDVDEFHELAVSVGIAPDEVVVVNLQRINPATFVGRGKLDELSERMEAENLDLLVVDHEITPTQQRNLEQRLGRRVITRTELILHVFEDRARTHEGKLQVELAMLKHAQSHIVRGWSHLDRQRGGVNLRGAGERQSAIDRGLVQARISVVEKRLEKVGTTRTQQRRQRDRNKVPTIALVGYTNAGKSTLFNAMTSGGVYADDRLFATLDPTLRKIELESGVSALLADTVGFIRDLPMTLVAAFKATLEEVTRADLLLHVTDCSAPNRVEMRQTVEEILAELGAQGIPTILVNNKVDLTEKSTGTKPDEIYVSATAGQGLADLARVIAQHFHCQTQKLVVRLDPSAGALRAWLHGIHAVNYESFLQDGGVLMEVALAEQQAEKLLASEHVTLQRDKVTKMYNNLVREA